MIKGSKVWKFSAMIIQSGNKAKLIMPNTTGFKLRTTYWVNLDGSGLHRAVTVLDYVKNKYALIISNNLRPFTETGSGEIFEVEGGK